MPLKRVAIASSVLFLVAIAWGSLVHLVLLRSANAVIQGLYRPDLADRVWWSLLVIAGMVVVFVLGYSRFARVGSVREGIGYGLFFAVFTGVFVDLNQYVMFPIPGWLAFLWFLGGLVEFSVCGIILSRFFQKRAR